MLVVLGGSSPWTVHLIERLDPPHAVLVGRDARALAALRGFLRARCATSVQVSTDPESALRRASVVLCQARIGGWPGRREDERGPPRWGGYGDETLGLGGLRGALRACRTLAGWARVAKHAPVVMLSNPTDLLTRWWSHHSEAEAISVCEVPTELMTAAPAGSRYLGVNHLGWAVTPSGDRIPTRWMRVADDLERHAMRQQAARANRADWLAALSLALRCAIAAGDHGRFDALVRHRPPHWYGTLVVPVLHALLRGHPFSGIVGLPNAGRLPSASSQVVVESTGSLAAPSRDEVPRQLVSDVAHLADVRERAWDVLLKPTADRLYDYMAADPFSDGARYSPAVLSWLVDPR